MARKQVTQEQLETLTGIDNPDAVYNTWYKKWSGVETKNNQRSQFRCDIEKDSGETKGTIPYICLWFARGVCIKGDQCKYLHRLPQDTDKFDITRDCFNRLKHGTVRDDMKGVGHIFDENKTLFIGYFKAQPSLAKKIREQFSKFGDISGFKVLKSFALVTYKQQSNAEFAKEAMSNQTVTGKETLTIKWSDQSKKSKSANTNKNKDAGGGDDELVDEILKKKIRSIVKSILNGNDKREHLETDTDEAPPPKKLKL